MGSGTTLVEAIVSGRRAYGTDINPVGACRPLLGDIKASVGIKHHGQVPFVPSNDLDIAIPDNKRLEYWFPEKQMVDLAIILSRINPIEDQNVRTFLLCAFSNILRECSRWMMKSVKLTVDKNKVIPDAYKSFVHQTRRMIIKNEFWKSLVVKILIVLWTMLMLTK